VIWKVIGIIVLFAPNAGKILKFCNIKKDMPCFNCKHYQPWGGLGDVALQHYCGKDGQIGVRCNPSESENCNGYKPREE
jgi:hypothetical protein